jgi:hypothetical protein
VAAVPCAEYCSTGSCGQHINGLYHFSKSTAGHLLNCERDSCTCTDGHKC